MDKKELVDKIKDAREDTRIQLTILAGEGNLLSVNDLFIFDYSYNNYEPNRIIEIAGDLDEYLNRLDKEHLLDFKNYINEVVNKRLNELD